MEQSNPIVKCEAYESNIAYLFEASNKSVIICPIKSEECPYQKSNIIEYETEQIGICETNGWIMSKEK